MMYAATKKRKMLVPIIPTKGKCLHYKNTITDTRTKNNWPSFRVFYTKITTTIWGNTVKLLLTLERCYAKIYICEIGALWNHETDHMMKEEKPWTK